MENRWNQLRFWWLHSHDMHCLFRILFSETDISEVLTATEEILTKEFSYACAG